MTIVRIVVLVLGCATSAVAQRLPTDVVPEHYDIRVDPDLAAATFAGEVTIAVNLRAPASAIVLNAADITFTSVQITAAGRTQAAQVSLDPARDQATFRVPSPLGAGRASIRISYTGILNGELRGFYLSKANNRRYAVTQLEATDARRMFPSFDEPAFKATYALTAVVDTGDVAISNGAVVSDTPGPRPGTHTVTFAKTPKMSSYLVALAVGDFVCNSGSADGIPIRICSTPDKKALTGFALESTQQIIRYFNRYYSIKYPFTKLDVVAVPDFAAGAMENTAAIFYRETLLLADAGASVGARRAIADVLAHEIAHQWFGDLVTMTWWDDLWLNEGFATWMSTKPVKQWKPEWQLEMAETASNQTAMNLDGLSSTRPIRTRASTPNEINELFDPIAYEKGAAVLRMIESWVGEQAFQKAINRYVEKFKYSNATAEDFWSTVAASTGRPVDRVMQTLVDQPGLPLVTLTASCQGEQAALTFSQSRYLAGGAPAAPASSSPIWQLPVCVRSDSGAPSCELLTKPQAVLNRRGCPSWIMPNAGGRGYYRAALDPAALAALASNITKLSGPERLTVLADEWALVRAGAHDVGSYLTLASAFGSERDPQVMASLTGALRAIERDLSTPATRPAFRLWVTRLLGPAATALGWDTDRAGTDDNARLLRASLLRQLGAAREPGAVAQARRLADQELARPGSVDTTLLNVAVNVAASTGDAALYEQYLARAQAAVEPETHYRYLYALTNFTEPALIRRTLDYAFGPDVKSQDTNGLFANLLGNEASRAITWEVLRERWDAVQKKSGGFGGNTTIVGALSSFCEASRAAEIKAFFDAHPAPDAARTLAQTLERVNACAVLAKAQSPKLAAWLEAKGGS